MVGACPGPVAEAIRSWPVATRRQPSVPLLVALVLIACLGPVFVHSLVGTTSDDDVQLTGSAAERAASQAPVGQPATGSVEAARPGGGGSSRGRSGASGRSTTTTTSERRATTTTSAPTPSSPSSLADDVVDLVNIDRSNAGCGPLTVDDRLATAAQLHSDDMSARHYMDHINPEGLDPTARAAAQGFTGAGIGENIAQGYPDPVAVMEGWLNSPGHKANIENCSYTVIGVGVNETGWYWTQVFGM